MKIGYGVQRVYVATLLGLLGELLEAASTTDPALRAELRGFPEGTVIGLSVLGGPTPLRVRKVGDRLVRLERDDPAVCDLELVFKHVTHAFLVLTFQEGTARAYARSRLVLHGDPALAMRFVRCLNRLEGVVLPRFVARRALKTLPRLPWTEKVAVAARVYGRVAAQALRFAPEGAR